MFSMPNLNDPWLVAVWPGMGRVALQAGEYLAKHLDMELVGSFPADEFFELSHVAVEEGVARAGSRPRLMVLVWKDPRERHDLVLLLGESQPPVRGYELCQSVMERARAWEVSRVIGFAAMATQMHPRKEARVFVAATGASLLQELEALGADILEEGQISGLNGLVLAAAQEQEIEAVCLLGELPYFAVQVPNPKASRSVLDIFCRMAGIEIDFADLDREVEQMDRRLTRLLEHLQQEEAGPIPGTEGEPEFGSGEFESPSAGDDREEEEPELDPDQRRRIERLFEHASADRSRAVELKRELDRLGVFEQYENRFLDLFKRGE